MTFATYGIDHLSPSTCNSFVASPAVFVLNKVLGRKSSVGAAAHRGTSVESGVAHGLMNPSAPMSECVDVAQEQFSRLTALGTDPRAEKEREGLAGMVTQAVIELRPYGVPTGTQGLVSYTDPDGLLEVPIIGYYDFIWPKALVDLKTTWALPNKVSVPHARQLALYKATTGSPSARVCYTTPKKVSVYEVENTDEHLAALVKIGLTIQRFLSISDDPQVLVGLVTPDVDSFYFNDPVTRAAVYEVWGL